MGDNGSARAAGWSSEGLRCWVEGEFLEETSHCRRWRGGKGFPGKVSFSFRSRAASTCQPALLPTFSHCWPAFLTAPGQEKEGIGSAGSQDHGCSGGAAWRLARLLGRWEERGLRWFYKAVLRTNATRPCLLCPGNPLLQGCL